MPACDLTDDSMVMLVTVTVTMMVIMMETVTMMVIMMETVTMMVIMMVTVTMMVIMMETVTMMHGDGIPFASPHCHIPHRILGPRCTCHYHQT